MDVEMMTKIGKAMAMLGSSNENERAIALNRVNAILTTERSSWTEVHAAFAKTTIINASAFWPPSSGFPPFTTGFSPVPEPAPRRTIFRGSKIFPNISGTVKVQDDRTTKLGKRITVITIVNKHAEYGPITCFDRNDELMAAEAAGAEIFAEIRQPTDDKFNPTLSRFAVGSDPHA